MPLPSRKNKEKKDQFLSRCMSDPVMNKEYPDKNKRYAICNQQSKASLLDQVLDVLFAKFNCACEDEDDCDSEEELTESNLVIPKPEDYVDFGEPLEEIVVSQYKYKDPRTGEIYYFSIRKNYTKEGRSLVYLGKAAEYQGRKVTLNKPFRTPDGPKKFAVYTKNDKGKVVIVRFGDPNLKIKKNIPERRKNFRARHGCDKDPGPKWKPKWWSCQWSW